jgi:hypothetical protein
MPRKLSKSAEETILEMYKSHFSAKDISEKIAISYPAIISRFKVYHELGIAKKNRFELIDKDKLEQLLPLVKENLEIGGKLDDSAS